MEASNAPSWLVQNKELIAAIGVLLGVVPRLLDILTQAQRDRREERELGLARQRLEVQKLQYDLERLRRDLGPVPTAVGVPAGPPPPAPTPGPAAAAPAALAPAAPTPSQPSPPPEWVDWLLAHAWLGRPLLFALQVLLASLFWASAVVAVAFPLTVLLDPSTRATFSTTEAIVVEAIYILMLMAFRVSHRKVRGWRRGSADHPLAPVAIE